MVARIVRGKDIAGLIRYNEKEQSSILYAQLINDAKDLEELTLKDKIQALQAYVNLNPKLTKPTFHVSLNPDISDKLGDEELREIGREYMERMHYGSQPYIIYKHTDIERTHIHIVSVSVGLNGKAIPSSKDRYRSEEIRKDLEVKYQLVKAGEKVRQGRNVFAPIDAGAIEYGKTDTKSAIAAVVRSAARDYACASLPEFRTLLSQYHVAVEEVKDPGDPEKTLGLLYGVLNREGEKVSKRIKASQIGGVAGYEQLLDKFSRDEKQIRESNVRALLGQKVRSVLDEYPYLSWAAFQERMKKQGVQAVLHHSTEGRVYGLTFIDTKAKTVLNGRSLGREFSAHSLQHRFTDCALSRLQLEAAGKKLAAVYQQWRKEDPSCYYESPLIRSLPQLAGRLAGTLQEQMPALSAGQAKVAVADFIRYRQGRLAGIEEKEKAFFLETAPAAIAFISRNQELSLKQKLSFLYAHNIAFTIQGGSLQVHAARNKEIGYELPATDISRLLQAEPASGKLTASPGEIPVLTKADKAIVREFAKLEKDRGCDPLPLVPIDKVSRLAVLPFMTGKDRQLLFSYANANYVAGFFEKLGKGLPYEETLSRMLESGILVQPVTDQDNRTVSYKLGYYRLPESSFVSAGRQVSDLFNTNGFHAHTAASIRNLVFRPTQDGSTRISFKYDVLVRLRQAWQDHDPKAAQNVVNLIHKINKPLACEIENKLKDYVKQSSGQDGPEGSAREKKQIEIIRQTIAVYPSDTLREPGREPAYANHYSPEAKEGASLLESIGDGITGLADVLFRQPGGVQPEQHRPEQKKKKRRRPHW